LEGDSVLLQCLIEQLREEPKFKLLVNYVFPLPKIVSLIAIYNSKGLLPSIGEITAATGETYGREKLSAAKWDVKPGRGVTLNYVTEDGVVSDVEYVYTDVDGWASKADRQNPPGWFGCPWDGWDRVLLRNTRARLKKLFKVYYRNRKFEPGGLEGEPSAGTIWLGALREAFKPTPGADMLPWWRKGKMRSNPFNAEGELCKNKG
jgi:hypothetical protein